MLCCGVTFLFILENTIKNIIFKIIIFNIILYSLRPPTALWAQTLCTATATCSGCQTGWRAATRSPASPAAPGQVTWRTSCSWPHPPRSSPAQVDTHTDKALAPPTSHTNYTHWNALTLRTNTLPSDTHTLDEDSQRRPQVAVLKSSLSWPTAMCANFEGETKQLLFNFFFFFLILVRFIFHIWKSVQEKINLTLWEKKTIYTKACLKMTQWKTWKGTRLFFTGQWWHDLSHLAENKVWCLQALLMLTFELDSFAFAVITWLKRIFNLTDAL